MANKITKEIFDDSEEKEEKIDTEELEIKDKIVEDSADAEDEVFGDDSGEDL